MTEDFQNSRPLVFFDGVCHLCNGFVDAVVARDKHRRILFAPLQGSTAARYLSPSQRQRLSSVMVWDGSQVLEKSDAVLFVFSLLPFLRPLSWMRLLPRRWRDQVYDFVARHRYQWFGKRETCRLPTPDERESLLP